MEILDCTFRDGGYTNNWKFDKKVVREGYRAISKSGIDIMELGFRSNKIHFDPKLYGAWRFCFEDDIREVTNGINGAKICVMSDFGKISINEFENVENSNVDMVRIAVHKNELRDCIELLGKIKNKGYQTSLQCMGYSRYTKKERQLLISTLNNVDIDYVYVADSYGSIYPFHIPSIFEPLLELDHIKVGFHPHNNIQMAFANTLEALRIGVKIIDTSIYGIGRGAGNLPTEILLSYLLKQGEKKYNVIPILNLIDQYFLEMKKSSPW